MLGASNPVTLLAEALVAPVTVKLSVARVGSKMPEIKFSKLVTLLMVGVK